jgi:hypothetical protein
MTTNFQPLKYQFSADEDEELHPPFLMTIDEEGDVWFEDGINVIMISYRQAQALHQTLGQALIVFDRQFEMLPMKPELKAYEND